MNKAFVKESDAEDDDAEPQQVLLPKGSKNYITPAGYARLQLELKTLVESERPKVVDIVSWAASNGDRSENGDYLYGKKRLREIDRRIRFLTKRLEIAQVVDPSVHHGKEQVFFGATVTYVRDDGSEQTITIMGVDEADPLQGQVSWVAPVARALLKASVGDEIRLMTPAGIEMIEVVDVSYPAPSSDHSASN
ncbi:transcription elongation factor GreB [Saezia sanguinis]|uniref:transcription elongation factor GreB n=1 Tax=Saezia sanguinis TaxID=1965230 RepID=UPI003062FB4E